MFPELENNKAEGKIYYSNSVEIFFCTSRQFNSIKMYIWIHLGFLLLMIVKGGKRSHTTFSFIGIGRILKQQRFLKFYLIFKKIEYEEFLFLF